MAVIQLMNSLQIFIIYFLCRCSINATPEVIDKALSATDQFLSNLPSSKDKMIGADFYKQHSEFEPRWCQTHFELPFQVNYMSRSIRTAEYTNPDFARYVE